MTDTNKPDISREAVGNLSDAVKTEARDALRRDDTTAYIMLLAASETLLALRDELDKYEKALTPSAETKAAYIGEFNFRFPMGVDEDGEETFATPNVPWTTIKEIMAAIRERALNKGE